MTPQRIQMRRTRGWRKPEGVIYVGRPTRWGNPYRVGGDLHIGPPWAGRNTIVRDAAHAVALYRKWIWTQARAEGMDAALRGHDLACWCPLDQPCHADVLLELANREGA